MLKTILLAICLVAAAAALGYSIGAPPQKVSTSYGANKFAMNSDVFSVLMQNHR